MKKVTREAAQSISRTMIVVLVVIFFMMMIIVMVSGSGAMARGLGDRNR
jgi:ABC-type Na+ efflux pump permease subunit